MTKSYYPLILIVLAIAVYFNVLFNGFVWDDEEQVVNNSLIHSITNLPNFFSGSTFNTGGSGSLGGLYYKPMMSTFFSLIYTIFGNNPFFFHLFQVIIHLINSTLVFYLLRTFFKEKLSLILALIFLVHPINTETVVYVSALQDTLYFLFGSFALLWAITRKAQSKTFLIVGLMLLLSLLSKETGLLFLLMLLIFKLLIDRKHLLGYILISATVIGVYSLLRFVVAGVSFGSGNLSPIMRIPFGERLINIPQILFFYLRTFFAPIDLSIAQHWTVKNIDLDSFYLPLTWVLTALVLAAAGMIYFKSKGQKQFLTFNFFFFWTIMGLAMHSQLVPLDMTVAERWFYFPIIGILGMIGVTIHNIKINTKFKTIYLSLTVLIVAALSLRTFIRTFDWRDGLTLFRHDITISQNAFDLENNLGVELYRVERFSEAKIHFEKSTRLAPYWWTNWNNLGVIYERDKDIKTAMDYYQKAIDNGHYYLAYENLARVLFLYEDSQTAEKFTLRALMVLPQNPRLWLTLALAENQIGKIDEAIMAAKKSYLLQPSQQSYNLYTRLEQGLPIEAQ